MAGDDPYPGAAARPEQVLRLADEYRRAAESLWRSSPRGSPLAWAPFRLTAIHAIELYLNALLMQRGHAACVVRGLQHDLTERAMLADGQGMRLRKKTRAHLDAIGAGRGGAGREYLVVRYGPECPIVAHPGRLWTTLEQVAAEVRRLTGTT